MTKDKLDEIRARHAAIKPDATPWCADLDATEARFFQHAHEDMGVLLAELDRVNGMVNALTAWAGRVCDEREMSALMNDLDGACCALEEDALRDRETKGRDA